jgi:hypothetical protein
MKITRKRQTQNVTLSPVPVPGERFCLAHFRAESKLGSAGDDILFFWKNLPLDEFQRNFIMDEPIALGPILDEGPFHESSKKILWVLDKYPTYSFIVIPIRESLVGFPARDFITRFTDTSLYLPRSTFLDTFNKYSPPDRENWQDIAHYYIWSPSKGQLILDLNKKIRESLSVRVEVQVFLDSLRSIISEYFSRWNKYKQLGDSPFPFTSNWVKIPDPNVPVVPHMLFLVPNCRVSSSMIKFGDILISYPRLRLGQIPQNWKNLNLIVPIKGQQVGFPLDKFLSYFVNVPINESLVGTFTNFPIESGGCSPAPEDWIHLQSLTIQPNFRTVRKHLFLVICQILDLATTDNMLNILTIIPQIVETILFKCNKIWLEQLGV